MSDTELPTIIVDRYQVHNAVLGTMRIFGDIGKYKFFTVEQLWANNKSGTAIPNGNYTLHLETFATRGLCYGFVGPHDASTLYHSTVGLWDEPENTRFACLIHSANWASQLLGCMAIGMKPAADGANEWGVGDSRAAIASFMHILHGAKKVPITLRGKF